MKSKESTGPSRSPSKAFASLALMLLLSPGIRAQEEAPKTVEPLAKDAKVAGQDVPAPSRRKYVAPEYPLDASSQGIRGIVILEVLIGEDGRVLNARVTRSIPGLDEAALTAIRLWEYEPTKLAGKPVKVVLSQSITFALRLPELQRAPGVPELRSGGAPPLPPGLKAPENASVALTLGSQGEVTEASVLDGIPAISEGLLRVVKSWRFVVSEGAAPPSFTVRVEWSPGPPPTLVLKALDPKVIQGETKPPPNATAAASTAAPTPASPPAGTPTAPSPSSTPDVATEVIPARPEPPAKEEGISAITDVVLGANLPDLVKGRRPVWPPLARLGAATGEVVVRFSVDLAGKCTVHSAEGPDLLKDSAQQAVGTWLFRRTAIDRLHLIATFTYGHDRTVAKVERAP